MAQVPISILATTKFFWKGYVGEYNKGLQTLYGLKVGMENFQNPSKTRKSRLASPIFVDGTVGLARGFVCKIVIGNHNGLPDICACFVEASAYVEAAKWTFSSYDNCAEIDWRNNIVNTSYQSTSSKSNNTGKIELSLFPLLLAMAINEFMKGSDCGKEFLNHWLSLSEFLKSIDELPMSGKSTAAQEMLAGSTIGTTHAEKLKTLILSVADEAYDFLRYKNSTAVNRNAQSVDWDFEYKSTSKVTGWRNGAADAKDLLLDPDRLKAFLQDRVYPRPANQPQPRVQPQQPQKPQQQATAQQPQAQQQPPATQQQATSAKSAARVSDKVKEPDGQQYTLYPWLRSLHRASRISMPGGGCYSTLLAGPAGTRKSTSVFAVGDGMPTMKLSVGSQSEVSILLGDYGRNQEGHWVPRLGALANAVRASQLAALCVVFKRGVKVVETLHKHSGSKAAQIIERLSISPDDKEARNELDLLTFPYYPEEWRVFQDAYFEAKANMVGPTVRVFLDEIHDAAENRTLETLLKVCLEDTRQVMLSVAGAGWCDLTGMNVQFIAAGNPDDAARRGSDFGRALKSRFGFTLPVGYPDNIQESEIALAVSQTAGTVFHRPPADLSLAAQTFEPPEWVAKPITKKMADRITEFANFTRTEKRAARLMECFDVRATVQVARTIAYLNTVTTADDAFKQAFEPIYPRLVAADEDGLPVSTDVDILRTKVTQLAKQL
jgi:MoxR-like ATPase